MRQVLNNKYIRASIPSIAVALLLIVAYYLGKAQTPPVVRSSSLMSQAQITLECQKIAATSTNSGWHYTDCLKEMTKADLGGLITN